MTDAVAALAALSRELRTLLDDPALAPWPTRADDAAAIAAAIERLERRYTLAVVGEFSSGKSYLLNALLGKARRDPSGRIVGLLATDINPSTATITELRHGSPERAVATFPSGRTERIPLDRLSRFVAVGRADDRGGIHDATGDDDAAPDVVLVETESAFLRGEEGSAGFTVADTPGLASLNPAHRRATLRYLPRADAVLYLIDTQQPFTEGDAAFLGLIGEHVRTIFIVQTKIDMWRGPETDGRSAWETARARITERAARLAPEAEVHAVSARDYAAAELDGDAELRERSGFPALLAGLERSLAERARAARVRRAHGAAAALAAKTDARLRREATLAETPAAELEGERDRAEAEIASREASLARARDAVLAAGAARAARIREQGSDLAERAVRAIGSAIDVADIERVRDRGKLHVLVDATSAPVWSAFADAVAAATALELETLAADRPGLRPADLAAVRLGGEPGTGAWSRDLRRGVASTIVLGAIGGPTVAFVHGVAGGFAAARRGAYMKRELGADLGATLFPQLARDVAAFVDDLATRIEGAYADAAAALERDRGTLRAETLEPIARAIAHASDPAAHAAAADARRTARAALAAIEEGLAAVAPAAAAPEAAAAHAVATAAAAGEPVFDAAAYDLGMRPERYRVVVLGALRRGKTSLINAIAGTRLLHDGGGAEALFPVHVRYGERERAYALETGGAWREIATADAMRTAASAPVLIETPWRLPRELVLVHAPAFDSGNAGAEAVAMAAATVASEIVGLFSRQLSDRELALYARAAELGRPMLLAHTIADNETAADRRTVVELAARYVRERAIEVSRIFTISALDFLDAAAAGRPASGWNELGALRETLAAHAEEHMRRTAERARAAAAAAAHADATVPKRPRGLGGLFGRR